MSDEHPNTKRAGGMVLVVSSVYAMGNHVVCAMAAKGELGVGPCGFLMFLSLLALIGLIVVVGMGVKDNKRLRIGYLSIPVWVWLIYFNLMMAGECSAAC